LPNIKAAIKWQRQTERRTLRNLDLKTRLKTLFKKAKATPEQASSVEAQFDKAARKGIIHPNKAARKKARLARAIRTAKALAAVAPVATATVTKKRGTKKK
jgi:small subunit ribosomal protein S20